jgi:hypothetical protein
VQPGVPPGEACFPLALLMDFKGCGRLGQTLGAPAERPFAWLGQNRRLSKDDERLCETSETMVYAAMSRLMVRRLAAP